MDRDVEARELGVDGAKADADASIRKERAPVSFILNKSDLICSEHELSLL